MTSRTTRLTVAFGIIYLTWGSTYLALRIGVHDLPPCLFAGTRFAIAGILMLLYTRLRGYALPKSRRDWHVIVITASMMLVGANGLVTWSEIYVESNQAALIVATAALWMAGIGTLGSRGEPLTRMTVAGLLFGFAGVAVLVGAGLQLQAAQPSAYIALIISPILWAGGSVYARRNPVQCAPLMSAALQMVFTGVVMCSLGLSLGEHARWSWHPPAIYALLYLIFIGSCLAYGVYTWLVHQVSPSRLATYAYVNPAVAVALGWFILDEKLTLSQLIGTAIILMGVIVVTLASHHSSRAARVVATQIEP